MITRFQSDHFQVEQVADGAYAAIASEWGAAASNAGIIDLGDLTLVIDACETPLAAQDLAKVALELTGRKPAVVLLTHSHHDHWGGLQVFGDCVILATEITRKAIIPEAERMLKYKADPTEIHKAIAQAQASIASETDPEKRKGVEVAIKRQGYLLESLPELKPTLPNLIYADQIILSGSMRTAEILVMGRGHTESDSIVYLREARTAFIGDLGFFQTQPFMAYSFPDEWCARLADLQAWEVDKFVPGHGPVGTKVDLALQAGYIQALETMVLEVISAGGTVEAALSSNLPAPYDTWQASGRRFERNVRGRFMNRMR